MNKMHFIKIRGEIIKAIRNFFYREKFDEVITSTLNYSIPTEPNIYPFATTWDTNFGRKKLYLSTSPEKELKKMLSLGLTKCFAISKSFRNLESSGTMHFPEFLMLEWYRQNANYHDIMKDVENLVNYLNSLINIYLNKKKRDGLIYQKKLINLSTPWPRISLSDLFFDITNIPFEKLLAQEEILFKYAKTKGYQTSDATWEELYNQVFVNEIEPYFKNSALFVIDFPAKLSPLCKPISDTPYLAQRFEIYIGNMEIGNGNTENTNHKIVSQSFKNEEARRKHQNQIYSPIDTDFLNSLKLMNKKSYAGIGIGIDRLAMLFSDSNNINDFRI